MKLNYHTDTNSLYNNLSERPSAKSRTDGTGAKSRNHPLA